METRGNPFLIGVFVLISIIASIIFFLWLGNVDQEYDEYDVIFTERVSGLSTGGAVLYNGIKVGEIRSLNLAPNDPTKVIARVRLSKNTPVKTDTKSELELTGLTGLAVIQFSGGSPEAALLKDVTRQKIPEIQASLSAPAKFLQGGTSILAGIQRVLSIENTDTVGEIIQDVKVMTGILADKEDEFSAMIDNMKLASDDIVVITNNLAESSQRIETIMSEVEVLLDTEAGGALSNLSNAAENASAVMVDVRALLEENRAAIDAFAQQGLGQTSAAVADMRRLIQTTDGILREIERDPAKFFFGDGRPQRKK